MVVLPRGSSLGLGFVLLPYGVDAPARSPDLHEVDVVLPGCLGGFSTEMVDDGGDLGGAEERTRVGPSQIGGVLAVGEPPADLPDDLWLTFEQSHRAVCAQVDVHLGRSRGEADEEVLAPGLCTVEDIPIERVGSDGPTLRTGGGGAMNDDSVDEVADRSVYHMAFRHLRAFLSPCRSICLVRCVVVVSRHGP